MPPVPDVEFVVTSPLCAWTLLDKLIQDGPFSEDDTRTVMQQLVGAVRYLHRQGIIHRDLTLDKILLVSEEEPIHVMVSVKPDILLPLHFMYCEGAPL